MLMSGTCRATIVTMEHVSIIIAERVD